MLLSDEDGTEQWVLHDRDSAMATTITVDVTDPAIQPQFERARGTVQHARARGLDGRVSTAIQGVRYEPLAPDALWVEEYHYVPLTGVMVDRRDYRR